MDIENKIAEVFAPIDNMKKSLSDMKKQKREENLNLKKYARNQRLKKPRKSRRILRRIKRKEPTPIQQLQFSFVDIIGRLGTKAYLMKQQMEATLNQLKEQKKQKSV